MKRILALSWVIAMVFSFAACGDEKMEKYCSNCGGGISKNVAFCEHCGASVVAPDNIQENSNDNVVSTNSNTNSDAVTSENNESSKPTTNFTKPTHKHSYTKKVTSPTCTAKGYTTYTCSCGHSYVDNYVNASHKFSNYKCLNCGQMDKENLYYCLKDWTLKNGEPNGDYMYYGIGKTNLEGGVTETKLSYNLSRNELIIFTTIQSGDSMIAATYLTIPTKVSNEYNYTCGVYSLPSYNREYFCTGKVEATSYNSNRAVACEYFEGDTNMRVTALELVRRMINTTLYACKEFYEESNMGYTIADMGFTNFN